MRSRGKETADKPLSTFNVLRYMTRIGTSCKQLKAMLHMPKLRHVANIETTLRQIVTELIFLAKIETKLKQIETELRFLAKIETKLKQIETEFKFLAKIKKN